MDSSSSNFSSEELNLSKQHMPEYCRGCGRLISDRYVMRMNEESWHESCIMCCVCGSNLTHSCHMKQGRLYCKYDYIKIFGFHCLGCSQPIYSNDLVMKSISGVYHLCCFICSYCGCLMKKGDQYVEYDGRIICRYDYETKLVFTESSPISLYGDCDNEDLDDSDSDSMKGCKRPRTILTTSQRRRFKSAFEVNPKPSRKIRENLAAETGLSVRVIQVWFQNQRAKVKKIARRQNQEVLNNNNNCSKCDHESGEKSDDSSRENLQTAALNLESSIPISMSSEETGDPIDKLYSMQQTYFT